MKKNLLEIFYSEMLEMKFTFHGATVVTWNNFATTTAKKYRKIKS